MIVFKLHDGTTEDVSGDNVDMSVAGVYKVYSGDCLVRTFKDYEVLSFSFNKDANIKGGKNDY